MVCIGSKSAAAPGTYAAAPFRDGSDSSRRAFCGTPSGSLNDGWICGCFRCSSPIGAKTQIRFRRRGREGKSTTGVFLVLIVLVHAGLPVLVRGGNTLR